MSLPRAAICSIPKSKMRHAAFPKLISGFLWATAFLFLVQACGSPAEKTVPVPDLIQSRFKAIYPYAKNPSWIAYEKTFEVTFTQDNNEWTIVFTPDGAVDKTKLKTSTAPLPGLVTEYVNQNLGGQPIDQVLKVVNAFGTQTWEISVGDTSCVFTSDGHFMGLLWNNGNPPAGGSQ